MVHYANFMASRAYLVQDNNSASPPIADSNAEQIAFNKDRPSYVAKMKTTRNIVTKRLKKKDAKKK